MKKSLIVVALTMVATSASSKETGRGPTLGGFYLGMTNARAAAIGLRDCKRQYSYSDINCVPVLPPLPGRTDARIRFDAKTKKAVEMTVHVWIWVGSSAPPLNTTRSVAPPWSASRWWQETNALAATVQAKLHPTCPSRLRETVSEARLVLESCYLGEVTQSVQIGYNEVYESSNGRSRLGGNEPHVQVLLTLKRDGSERRYHIQRKIAAETRKEQFNARDFESGN